MACLTLTHSSSVLVSVGGFFLCGKVALSCHQSEEAYIGQSVYSLNQGKEVQQLHVKLVKGTCVYESLVNLKR